jgi:hypothetical protein
MFQMGRFALPRKKENDLRQGSLESFKQTLPCGLAHNVFLLERQA